MAAVVLTAFHLEVTHDESTRILSSRRSLADQRCVRGSATALCAGALMLAPVQAGRDPRSVTQYATLRW
jgi:hypothetical protein